MTGSVPRVFPDGADGDEALAGAPSPVERLPPGRLIAPVFAVGALVAPSVIASFNALSLHHSATAGGASPLQFVLSSVGVSLGVSTIALSLYHNRWARRLLHLFLFSILLELFYRFAYGGAVSPGILLSVPETSTRETGELLAGHAMLTTSLSVVALLAIYALVVSWRADIRFSPRRCACAGILSAVMILGSLAMGATQPGRTEALAPLMSTELQATYPFDVATALGGVAAGMGDTLRLASRRAAFRFPDAHLVDAVSRRDTPEVYVIVIGETSRRLNWSLFGYPRTTTPRLDAIKRNLILFDRLSSNATNTILSVPLALTRAVPADRELARSEKSVVTLLREAGFETFWISNQVRSDVLFNPISQIALEADHVSFPKDLPSGGRGDGFDSNLLTRLNEALAGLPKNGKAVFFLHMEGSHFGYKERYPPGFDLFHGGTGSPRTLPAKQMELVDEYDNSIYFTDYNLRGIVDRLRLCRCRAGMIFFSDHGERLFDDGLADGDFGHGFPTVSRQEIDIPFVVWLSDAYREANPSPVAHLESNAQSVAELDDLFETVVDLAGVDYRGRDGALSLFSAAFESPRRLEVLNTNEAAVYLPTETASHDELSMTTR